MTLKTSTTSSQSGEQTPALANRLRTRPSGRVRRRRRWDLVGYLFIAPALLVYILFALTPVGETVWYSLFEWDGIGPSTWVGIQNYVHLFQNDQIPSAVLHSCVLLIFYSWIPAAIGLVLAGMITRIRVRWLTGFRALLFLPQILSSVVVAVAWRGLFAYNGPVNAFLRLVGLGSLARPWLGDFSTALPSVGVIGTWVEFGLCMMLFLAGAQRIPRELYEAARIDGAGAVREFLVVTVPSLRAELRVVLLLTTIFALRNFDIIWNTTQGGPGSQTTVPSVYVYQDAFVSHKVGAAAAFAVVLTLFILVVVSVVQSALRERKV